MNTPLHALPLWAGLLPLGLYLMGLGAVHLRRKPFVVSGAWDGLLLGASLLGLLVVGPLALVQPVAGSPLWSWPMLLAAVALVVAICLLVSRPRVVVYNITIEQLRPLVAEVVSALDPGARWAGESAALPGRSLQVHLEGNGSMRSVNVVAVGERTSLESWSEFSRRLRQSAGRLRVRASPWGLPFTTAGLLIVAAAAWAAGTTLLGRDRSTTVDDARESTPAGSPTRGGEPGAPSAAAPRDRLPPELFVPRPATRQAASIQGALDARPRRPVGA